MDTTPKECCLCGDSKYFGYFGCRDCGFIICHWCFGGNTACECGKTLRWEDEHREKA